MAKNYVFSLEPTFTQGLILGQLSILLLLGLVLKYIFLDSAQVNRDDNSSYQPPLNIKYATNHRSIPAETSEEDKTHNLHGGRMQVDWLNELTKQVSFYGCVLVA
jgi:maintenance of mitochondrial morphology protein 1